MSCVFDFSDGDDEEEGEEGEEGAGNAKHGLDAHLSRARLWQHRLQQRRLTGQHDARIRARPKTAPVVAEAQDADRREEQLPAVVAYVMCKEALLAVNRHPANVGRLAMVHSLIMGLGLGPHLRCLRPRAASKADLRRFHTARYVQVLQSTGVAEATAPPPGGVATGQHGLSMDCPVFPGLWDTVRWIAGGSLWAARALSARSCRTAIHWAGGRHHARADAASGFCYVGDIQLAILELRRTFARVAYIDVDAHHGDAVERAFRGSAHVCTLSFHEWGTGIFPCTGSGKQDTDTAINVPRPQCEGDDTFVPTFVQTCERMRASFKPQVVILQCGADALVGEDPSYGRSRLTTKGIGACVANVRDWNLPLLLLGGGGYNHANTARLWAYLTAIAVRQEGAYASDDTPIPPDDPYAARYGPSYRLHVRLPASLVPQTSDGVTVIEPAK